MIGNTITLNDGSERVLVKINQDNYSSEFMLRDSLLQYVARIRHSRTKGTVASPQKERHNFEVVRTVFATDTTPQVVTKFYFVMEQESSDTNVALADAVCDLSIASSQQFLKDLLAWQS